MERSMTHSARDESPSPTPAETLAPADAYASCLRDYLLTHGEEALYRASLLSRSFVEGGLGPEEIVALHGEAFSQAVGGLSYREQARASMDAIQFLLEVMIAYGVQHREYMEMRLRETARLAAEQTDEER